MPNQIQKSEQLKNLFEQASAAGTLNAAMSAEGRAKAIEAFLENGLPTVKDEYWKYTDLHRFLKGEFSVSSSLPSLDGLKKSWLTQGDGLTIFVGDGKVLDVTGDLGSVQLHYGGNVVEPQGARSALEHLNLALQNDRLKIVVPKNEIVENPVRILYTASGSEDKGLAWSTHWLEVEVEEGAEVQFVEAFELTKTRGAVVNAGARFNIKTNAKAELLRLIVGSEDSKYLGQTRVDQARDSFFAVTTYSAGGELTRQSYDIQQNDENADTECNGLYLTEGSEHVDHRVTMNHLKPNGRSRQLYKGVLKDKSRSVFNGKIYIEKDAQKIDSNQLNNNLILSKYAEADSKPELEVYADDVKANHGSAIGRLDEDQLFYLMSRCLSRAEAIQFLARGFVKDVSLHIRSKTLRGIADRWILEQFKGFQASIEEGARKRDAH